jgi:flagellar hook protein FlgE
MMISATSSAVRGLNDAAFRFDKSAQNIASGSTDLPTDIVEGEMLAPTAYTANAKVLETQAAMTQALLDIRA